MIIFRVGFFLILQLFAISAYAINLKGIYNRIVTNGYQEQLRQAKLLKKKQQAMWFVQLDLTPRENELYAQLFKNISNKSANAGPGSEFLVKLIEDIDFSKVDGSQDSIIHAITENIANKKDTLFLASDPEIKPIVSELFKSNAMNSVTILATLYVTLLTSWPKVVDQEEFRRAYNNLANTKQVQDAVQEIIQNPKLQPKEKRKSLQLLEQEIKQIVLAQISKPLVGKEWNDKAGNLLNEWSETVSNAEAFSKIEFRKPVILKPFVFETPYYSLSDERERLYKNKKKHLNSIVSNLELFQSYYADELQRAKARFDAVDPLELEKCCIFLGVNGNEPKEMLEKKANELKKANAKIWHPDKYQDPKGKNWATEQMNMIGHAPQYIHSWQQKKIELEMVQRQVERPLAFLGLWINKYKEIQKNSENVYLPANHSNQYLSKLIRKPKRDLYPLVEKFSKEEIDQMGDAEIRLKIKQTLLYADLVNVRGPKSLKTVEFEQD
ncbi:MAG TPA: hypothetical protein VHO47_03205 [Candidatus Babeliales bacterium]|nr:hypothetical protein [Candidatus Babeliales bacterium]